MNIGHGTYIEKIDGLRAVAIIWVLLFHYFPNTFTGGYIGVDVFFVISGYLISGIIWKDLEAKNFTFYDFYSRRIRRIFPALLIVLMTTLLAGSLFLHNSELKQLAKHSFAASLFLNNWALSIEKGYFDIDSEDKPLLHLWSLSIEEQFYLIWPFLLLSISLFFKKQVSVRWVLIILAAASLLACILQTPTQPVGSFYSPHTRMWELISGALLHFIPTKLKEWLGKLDVTACVVLLLCLFLLTPAHPFPGYWALPPVMSALILICATGNSQTSRLLSKQILVGIGRISYPLYLWHWPILAIAQIFAGENLTWSWRIFLIVCCFLLSIATKKWIEDPIRYGNKEKTKTFSMVALMVMISLFSVYVYESGGLPNRRFNNLNLSLNSGDIANAKSHFKRECPSISTSDVECWSTGGSEAHGAVIGDSKGKALFLGISNVAPSNSGWIYLGGNANAGAPVPQYRTDRSKQADQIDVIIDILDRHPEISKVVLTVAVRSLYQLKRDDTLQELETISSEKQFQVEKAVYDSLYKLSRKNRQVYIILDNPTFSHPPRCVSRRIGVSFVDDWEIKRSHGCTMSLETHFQQTKIYRDMLSKVKSDLANQNVKIKLIDSSDVLCDQHFAKCEMTLNNRYLYDFTDHISNHGAVLVAQHLLKHMP